MSYRRIPLSDLIVNRANDRHGELENETAAMAWLFNNREQHMRKLALDIAEQGEVYEPPLVVPDGERFIVSDGNRRVTCLKVLADPQKAPDSEWQQYFSDLRVAWNGKFPDKILCQIEQDRERVDEILYRRHTGTQSGVGQSTWDDRMKRNFVERTGKRSSFNVADEIEKRLRQANLLSHTLKIPRSTLNRLLSSEAFRNRLGFSVLNGQFQLLHEESVVLNAFRRVAEDLSRRRVVLGDLWDVEGKQTYLDRLEAENVLPAAPLKYVANSDRDLKPSTANVSRSPAARSAVRKNLIPHFDYGVAWAGKLQRQHAIWNELQFDLELKRHPNAIAVLLRVLIELSVDNYIDQHQLANVHPNDKLGSRIIKAAEDLRARGKITEKYLVEIRKFQHQDKLLSTDTLNRWVHSQSFAPSAEHLKAMWDTLSGLVVNCLNG